MREWFWAWILAAAGIGIVSAATKDRYSAPWAAGCLAAAALEWFGVHPGWQWGAFLAVSAAVFLAVNRVPRYSGRHARRGGARR